MSLDLDLNVSESTKSYGLTSHGFTMLGASGNVPIPALIDSSTGNPEAADAANPQLESFGLIIVDDANNITYRMRDGLIEAPGHGFTVGDILYLQDGGGLAPTMGTYLQKIYEVVDTNCLNYLRQGMDEVVTGTASVFYEVFNQAAGLTYTTTPELVPFDNETIPHSNFTLNADGSVTYTGNDAWFEINYSIIGNSGSTARSVSRAGLYRNGTLEAKTQSFAYHRTTADGEGNKTKRFKLQVNNGDVIDIRVDEENTNDNVVLLVGHSLWGFTKLRDA